MSLLSFKQHPKLEWQKLKSKNKKVPDLYRSPIFGGWLISNGDYGAITFIPDPNHKWDGESYPILD